MRHLTVVLLTVVMAGCGSSDGGRATSSSRPSSAVSSSVAATASAPPAASPASDCPLTEEQVQAAVGASVPQVPGPATAQVTCTFATTTGGGVDFSHAGVVVVPFNDDVKAMHEKLVSIGADAATFEQVPKWGEGAFYEYVHAAGNPDFDIPARLDLDVFLPGWHINVTLPGFDGDPRSIAEKIGDAAASVGG